MLPGFESLSLRKFITSSGCSVARLSRHALGVKVAVEMYFVYILYSRSLNKFYVGQTNNLNDRLIRHNMAREKFTKNGIPWDLIHNMEVESRSEALILERKIKKRGAKRFLEDLKK